MTFVSLAPGSCRIMGLAFAILVVLAGPASAQERPGTPLTPSADIGGAAPIEVPAGTDGLPPSPAASDTLSVPLPSPASDEPLTVYFATNRTPVPDTTRPERFNNTRRDFAVFGSVVVDPANDYAVVAGSIEVDAMGGVALGAPADLAAAASAPPAAGTAEALPQGPLGAFAAATVDDETDVLVHIHGAGHDFISAVSEIARIALTYNRDGAEIVPLLFTYPTNGRGTPVSYFLDRGDARRSGPAMAAAFERLVAFLVEARGEGAGRTILMGHSLGVYTMRVGVQAVSQRLGELTKVFDIAFLMGGDEDSDTLSHPDKMRPLLELADRVSVYFAPRDVLMWVSRLGNLRKPIGLDGPRNVSSEDYSGVPVAAVNAVEFAFQNDPRGHNYHWSSPRVIEDARQPFAGVPAVDVTGRAPRAPRVFAIVPPPGGLFGLSAEAPATTERDVSSARDLYIFNAAPFLADGPQTDAAAPMSGEAGAGVITVFESVAVADVATIQQAAAALPNAELLPGRFDAVLVAGEIGADGSFHVKAPSKTYLDAVLPRGFSQDGTMRLAGKGEPGRLSFAVANGETVIAEPSTSDDAGWQGRIVQKGPPGGPFEPASGSIALTFDERGRPIGTITMDDSTFFVRPQDEGAVILRD